MYGEVGTSWTWFLFDLIPKLRMVDRAAKEVKSGKELVRLFFVCTTFSMFFLLLLLRSFLCPRVQHFFVVSSSCKRRNVTTFGTFYSWYLLPLASISPHQMTATEMRWSVRLAGWHAAAIMLYSGNCLLFFEPGLIKKMFCPNDAFMAGSSKRCLGHVWSHFFALRYSFQIGQTTDVSRFFLAI